MDLDRFLNLLASVLGAMGSIYVLKSVAALSPNLIERLSRTYSSFSAAQIDALTAQKADSVVGIVLVVAALSVAVVNIAVVPPGLQLLKRRSVAVALVAVVAIVGWLVLALVRDAIHNHEKVAVGEIISAEAIQKMIDEKRLSASGAVSLRVYASTLLGMNVQESEPPRLLFERLAERVGLEVPAEFDFSEVEDPAVR